MNLCMNNILLKQKKNDMYKFDEANRFPRGLHSRGKNIPVENKRKFISAICIGIICVV